MTQNECFSLLTHTKQLLLVFDTTAGIGEWMDIQTWKLKWLFRFEYSQVLENKSTRPTVLQCHQSFTSDKARWKTSFEDE